MDLNRNWYKEWFNSPYYYLLYSNRNDKEAAAFVDRLIQYLHPAPAARLLDIGCGRGRHAKHLAAKGLDVTGIDIAAESIRIAKNFENDNLTFYLHDMRLPFRIRYYDMALNFFTSFGYFETQREHDDALRSIAQSLKPGGTLVLDYLNSNYVRQHLVKEEIKIMEGVEFIIHRSMEEANNKFVKNIFIDDKLNLVKQEFTERVSAFTLHDFETMFAKQGLKIIEVFGDYHLNMFDENIAPRLLLIANKAA